VGGGSISNTSSRRRSNRSKGCARTFPWHQDRLLAWLDLDDVTEATWQESRIGVTVAVIGDFRTDP
ncbi:MAG: hypothetical protein ABIP17_11425, partial [Ilumatobacteraceae bacterium]